MNTITYAIPADLLQAIVGTLNQMPAAQSRGILNGIEAECVRQDNERAEKMKADIIAEANRARDAA